MLRNLSKYYLFICCKQSSSTHFCHFLTTDLEIRGPEGSNPSAMGAKRKASIAGGLTIQWWAMRDVRVRLAPPAPRFVASLFACCAGKRFAFPQLRTLAGSNPMHLAQKRKASIAGGLTNQWWAMRDVACGWRRPLPLRACGPRVLRWKTLARFLSSAPLRVRIPRNGPIQKRSPFEDRFQFGGGR